MQFRWRCGTDNFGSAPGWRIDDVRFEETACCSTPQDIIRFAPSSSAATSVVVRSVGANATIAAEYTTNLVGTQVWQSVSNGSNTWNNGTNTTTFALPTNLNQYIIRLIQSP